MLVSMGPSVQAQKLFVFVARLNCHILFFGSIPRIFQNAFQENYGWLFVIVAIKLRKLTPLYFWKLRNSEVIKTIFLIE